MEKQRANRILLCAAGGYQSYMLPGFILSLLQHAADDVQVVLSRAASKLVSVYSVEVASRHKAYIELDDQGPGTFVPHIELARDADLVLIYPGTVNMAGKLANGICDELIAAIVLGTDKPVIFVPIANDLMWEHPAARRNLARLREDGYVVLDPLPNVEVATREGLEKGGPFPMPTLLLQLRSALRGNIGIARRTGKG